nr:hypothetical protein [Chlorobaculum sp. 24CR]
MKVVAVSDSKGGIINPDGLEHTTLTKHKKRTGSVAGFPGSTPITDAELLDDTDAIAPTILSPIR